MTPDQRIYTVNGLQMHVCLAGESNKPVIMFLHGFPEMGQAWHRQLQFFAQQGFLAVAPDQRGYNNSSKPAGVRAYTLSQLTADIAALIRQLGTEKIYLAGHDWGGAIAWAMALQYPELIQKIIILNMPHPVVLHEHLKHNPRQQRRSWYTAFFQLPFLPELLLRLYNFKLLEKTLENTALPHTFPPEQIAAYKAAWQQPGALTAMINWYRAYQYNPLTAKSLVSMPALLLWGEKDAFLGKELAQPSIARCSHGRLEYLPEATHWLHHEQPDVINQLVLDFIKR